MYRYYTRKLTFKLSRCGGRNVFGHITARGRGGGCKRHYRFVDFYRRMNSFGVIVSREHDPNRSAYVALIYYLNGVFAYIIAYENMQLGDIVFSGNKLAKANRFIIKLVQKLECSVFFEEGLRGMRFEGTAVPLGYVPQGLFVHNVEFYPGSGAKLARAAGACALVIRKESKQVLLKLRSGFVVYVSDKCFGTIGKVLGFGVGRSSLRKAGISRCLGHRPSVRGVAMSASDHPHGGGEGKSSGGRPSATPWGRLTKGQPTVLLSRRRRRSNVYSYRQKRLR